MSTATFVPYDGWEDDLWHMAQEIASWRGRSDVHPTGLIFGQGERLLGAFVPPHEHDWRLDVHASERFTRPRVLCAVDGCDEERRVSPISSLPKTAMPKRMGPEPEESGR